MRDLLTFLAGLVVLALVAALAVPPFIDWRVYREYVDSALARAAGAAVLTEGALDIRFLPSPRVRIERLQLGSSDPDSPSLDARFVKAEIALAPLLAGEVRFLDSRIGRAEVKLPTGAGGDWRVPRSLVSGETLRRAFVFEDLAVTQLLLTTVDPGTGRTDQVYAEGVHLQSQSLAGPWRIEGSLRGTPFSLATGEVGPDLSTNVKLSAGAEGGRRLSLDARLGLSPGIGETLVPNLAGTAKIVSGAPPGATREETAAPLTLSTQFETAGQVAELRAVTIEAGQGGSALRLSGTGRFSAAPPVLSLNLDGRRLDLGDLSTSSGERTLGRLQQLRPPPGLPVDVSLRLDSVSIAGEEFTGVGAQARLSDERLVVHSAEAALSGPTSIGIAGEVGFEAGASATGRVTLNAKSGERVASLLAGLGAAPSLASAFEGRSVDAAADVTVAPPVLSLRNLRVQLGDGTLTGALRFTGPEAGTRARLDAQLAIQNLDLTSTPVSAGLFDATRTLDLGLILDARNVGYGSAERGGRIAARIVSDGPSLAIERLEIASLAGANANLSGRIGQDGAGRISGRLTAQKAAPLIGLIGPFWLGGLADLVPAFLREGSVDLEVTAERAATGGGDAPALATRLTGSSGPGKLEAQIVTAEGRVRTLSATVSTDRTASWFGGPDSAATTGPSRIALTGTRNPSGRLALSASGDVAGLKLATSRPFALGERDDEIGDGEVDLSSDDLGPLLSLAGQGAGDKVPLSLHAAISRMAGVPRVAMSGSVAGVPVGADLFGHSVASLGGEVSLGRLSLPWLAGAMALGPAPAAQGGSVWPTARFTPDRRAPLGGDVEIKAERLDLGRGLAGERARFTLATTEDGFAIRDLEAGLGGGQLKGSFTLTRQGGQAALLGDGQVSGVPLSAFVGAPFSGRLTGDLRFGGSGESAAGLVTNLGGAGQIRIDDLRVAGADPAGVERAAARALRSDDPLAGPRLAAYAGEELDRAGFGAVGPVSGSATLVGGALRIAPVRAESAAGTWLGSVGIDLRSMVLDIRGSLQPASPPRNWVGAKPYLALGWTGPLTRPVRTVDTGPLANGLASVVLTRELDRIETFELDAAERARRNARTEMDRARRLAEEEAARQARLREQEAERARVEAERARISGEASGSPSPLVPPPPTARPVAPSSGG